MEYPTVFDLIANAAKQANVRLILIGGFAVNAYGIARNTRDVDFLTTDEAYPQLREVLARSGYEEDARSDVCAKLRHKDPQAMPVDFVFVDAETFSAIWKSSRDSVASGHTFKVPSLLHLIALKMHAIKKGSKDRVWRDLPDIINLVTANQIDVSSPEFLGVCRRFGPEGIHQKIQDACRGDSDGRS
jgi:hypothetical protein